MWRMTLDGEEVQKCLAFRRGIPKKIFRGEFDHNQPWPNAKKPTDHGYRYREKEVFF